MDTATRLFAAAGEADPARYLERALPACMAALGTDWAGVFHGEKGVWRARIASSSLRKPSEDLLADAIAEEEPLARGEWQAAPLGSQSGDVLAIYRPQAEPKTLETLLEWLAAGLAAARARQREDRRGQRLAALLEIVGQARPKQDTDSLLHDLAETATRLLRAERATIFLWDKPRKQLIGKPALGVAEGMLRIPEDAGVVGQVVHSGETRRVDADIANEQREVDRRIDKQLKFQTRTLLCVPLINRKGETFGAFEVINKVGGNFTQDDLADLAEIAAHAALAIANSSRVEQIERAREQVTEEAAGRVQLLGESPAIQALRTAVRRVADTDLSILILGENGTGKEVIGQMAHYLSKRRGEPLVTVNCAAISETLLESELFGHEKGAFTDAREARAGKFELASRGTLFLDEIGDMSLAGQAKLLRVLEEKVVVRVGGSTPIPTDTRVIAATNQNLAALVREKKFREDLFFRLNVVSLELPPLRERGEDVLLLAEHFLKTFCSRARRPMFKLTAAAKKRLLGHSWPGNVRELRNLMERIAYLLPEDQEKLDADELSFILTPDPSAAGVMNLNSPLADATRRFQIEYIKRQIGTSRGNMTLAAQRLGLHRSNLYRKMRQLGMEVEEE
jgi:Nif-specific regulatory protein